MRHPPEPEVSPEAEDPVEVATVAPVERWIATAVEPYPTPSAMITMRRQEMAVAMEPVPRDGAWEDPEGAPAIPEGTARREPRAILAAEVRGQAHPVRSSATTGFLPGGCQVLQDLPVEVVEAAADREAATMEPTATEPEEVAEDQEESLPPSQGVAAPGVEEVSACWYWAHRMWS